MNSYLFKFSIIGDSNCGKTCIAENLLGNEFNEFFQPTIGVEFYTKQYKISNNLCKLQLWNTGGDSRFKDIIKCYFKKCIGFILVYDITNKKSFENIKYWIDEIKKIKKEKQFYLFLLGNKKDLKDKIEINYEEGLKLSKENDILLFEEVSAKTGFNVNSSFEKITKKINSFLQKIKNEDGIKIQYENIIDKKKYRVCNFW